MTHTGTAGIPVQPTTLDREDNNSTAPGRSYLGVGLYSLPEAARLARMPVATLRRWAGEGRSPANERPSSSMPLVQREDPELIVQGLLTFSELVALLLIHRLRQAGMPLAGIRSMAQQAAAALQTSHPLVTHRFYSDWPGLLASKNDAELASSRPAIQLVLESFAGQLDYAEDDAVNGYWPLGKERRVVLDPARAFGQPIDPVSGVPTRALAGMSTAGETIEDIARWYRVDLDAVRDAIQFEQSLTAARLPRAA
jgi:uncharacterized protein (DUF433 family)